MAYIEFKKVDKIYQMGEVEIKALKDIRSKWCRENNLS